MNSFFSKIFNGIKKAFGFSKTWYVRLGLGKFLDKYIPEFLGLVTKLAAVNNNAAFHTWYDEAFAEAQKIAGDAKGTWIAIALNAAYELFQRSKAPASGK